MTAVNLNATGNIKQLMQSVSPMPTVTRKDVSKQDFETVMNDKVKMKADKKEPAAPESVKQPNRTEVKNSGNPRTKVFTSSKEEKAVTEDADVTLVAQEIIAGIAQILNIQPEELQNAMETLNLEVGDLVDRNNMASLVLMLNGSNDISDMLVDNGMLETFNELNDFVADTLNTAGINPEDFKSMIENAAQEEENDVLSLETENEVRVEKPVEKTETVVKEDSTLQVDNEENNVPEVSVVKHEDSNNTGTGESSENDDQDVFYEKTEDNTLPKPVRTERNDVNIAENFVRNLEMAVEGTEEIQENVPDIREIVYQVVDRIRVDISPDNTSMEMQLNPENLGRVSINISSKEGVMTAQINTENRQAREAIESQLQILKDNIEAKGIRVEAVEVRISDFNLSDSRNSDNSSEEYENRSQGRSRRNRGFNVDEANEDTEAERIENEVLVSTGSTVSYRA